VGHHRGVRGRADRRQHKTEEQHVRGASVHRRGTGRQRGQRGGGEVVDEGMAAAAGMVGVGADEVDGPRRKIAGVAEQRRVRGQQRINLLGPAQRREDPHGVNARGRGAGRRVGAGM
jgi:hypothetical protein